MSTSRGGSRGGGDRDSRQVGPDGWSVASGPSRAPPKAGDLSHFGKSNNMTITTFGPSSVFAGKKEPKCHDASVSWTVSTSNMFPCSRNPSLQLRQLLRSRADLPAATPASTLPSLVDFPRLPPNAGSSNSCLVLKLSKKPRLRTRLQDQCQMTRPQRELPRTSESSSLRALRTTPNRTSALCRRNTASASSTSSS